MAEPVPPTLPDLPEAEVRVRKGIPGLSTVWLIPAVAAAIGLWLAVKTVTEKGPDIAISFKTAEGIQAEKTRVKLRDVDVGVVENIGFDDQLSHIVVSASLDRKVEPFLTSGTQFWVVRPRIGTGGISGLGTLVSGAYIAMEPGKGQETREFTGLEEPPVIKSGAPGTSFVLEAATLGSINVRSPVYFRGLKVGEVTQYELARDDASVLIHVFVNAPHDAYVRDTTRFWNASGVDFSVDADGMKLRSESFESMLLGGIAFETPRNLEKGVAAAGGAHFKLFRDLASAEDERYGRKVPFVMYFDRSVRGLKIGAPVEFRGIRLGRVTDIKLLVDVNDLGVHIPVLAEIEPERLETQGGALPEPSRAIDHLVRRGMRAQLAIGNFLTGQLLVALDMHPDLPEQGLGQDGDYPVIPTIPSSIEEITRSATDLLAKLQAVPVETIGRDVAEAARGFNSAMADMRKLTQGLQETPEALNGTLRELRKVATAVEEMVSAGSPMRYEAVETLKELSAAARSIRIMAEYLERHPEALLSGKGTPSRK